MRGYVYLIGSSTFGWYKIGKARSPKIRVHELGILLPFKIILFALWRTDDYSTLETELHKKHIEYAINGEWFHFEPIKISEIILKTEAELIYPSRSPNEAFINFSNILKDVFKLNPDRYSKRGKPQVSRVVQEQYRLRARLYKEARNEFFRQNSLIDTVENRRLAKKYLTETFDSIKRDA